tara:strand:- start:230 stop:490 length:261 start_codon:yes stop_codon:yes gene_type:complete
MDRSIRAVEIIVNCVHFFADYVVPNDTYIVYGNGDMKYIEAISEVTTGVPVTASGDCKTEQRVIITTINTFDDSMTETWFKIKERK